MVTPMDHRGKTLFTGDGVTLGGELSIHLDSRMARGAHLPYQPFVSHLLYFGSLKEVKAFAQLWGLVQLSLSSGQVGLPRKKIRIEEVTDSDPQPESASSNQASQPNQTGKVCATGVGSTQVRRDDPFAKLSRKAQLYETAKDRFQKCLTYHNQHFRESLSEADFIKNLARLERRKAKALAEQLMTAPVEVSVPTVQPSATVLDEAEMAVVQAVISDTSAKLIEGLVEGHLYQLVNGRFVECELTHSGSVRARSSVPSTQLSTVPIFEQPSYFASLYWFRGRTGKVVN
jgi:hypothetical protein